MATIKRLSLGAVTGVIALLLSASSAVAATPIASTDVAQNLAGELTHWATLIIVPTGALMALPALFKRDVGHAVVTGGIVMIVGTLAFDARGVQTFVESVAKKVLA